MENKKTTELLDLIYKAEKKEDWEAVTEIREVLLEREPFYTASHDDNGMLLSESLNETDKNVKILKRHKHDQKTNDVMIRI